MSLGFVKLPSLDWLPRRLSVGHKVAGLATLSMIAVLAISTGINLFEARSLADLELQSALRTAEASLAAKIEDQARRALTAASLVAGMPSVQKALAAQDRAALNGEFVPQFRALREQFGVQQMQFHLPPATSFLRVHRPERFGDDLTEIRPGIVEVNTNRRPVSGLEIGREGLGLRGIVPVLSDGRHVGSVEVGLSFDDAFFQAFKRQSGIDAGLFLADGSALVYFAASTPSFKELDLPAIVDGLKGAKIIDRVVIDGIQRAAIASPVRDFAKRTIGVSVKAIDRSSFDAMLNHALQVSGALAGGVLVLALLAIWIMSRTVGRPLGEMASIMKRMSIGDLSTNYEPTGRNDEIGDLEKVPKRFRKTIKANREMTADQKVMMSRQTEMLARLSETAERVSESIEAIRSAAGEISQGSSDLATRTERQASALQQTVATMTEVSKNVSANAENSEKARELAAGALTRAESGNTAVASVIQAMSGIESSSSRIAAIIAVMEEISFQTKLLALNAAVEAARAGESGKGFAVVAQEVRALADRSRQASQQIRDLIAQSAKEVGQGVRLAGGAGEALTSIIEIVRRVAEIAPEIAAGSREQSRSIAEINRALNELDTATQQNAALVEESSAAAASLADQAGQLVKVASGFRNEGRQGASSSAAGS